MTPCKRCGEPVGMIVIGIQKTQPEFCAPCSQIILTGADGLADHPRHGDDPTHREWWSGGAWIHPGQRIIIIDVEKT